MDTFTCNGLLDVKFNSLSWILQISQIRPAYSVLFRKISTGLVGVLLGYWVKPRLSESYMHSEAPYRDLQGGSGGDGWGNLVKHLAVTYRALATEWRGWLREPAQSLLRLLLWPPWRQGQLLSTLPSWPVPRERTAPFLLCIDTFCDPGRGLVEAFFV